MQNAPISIKKAMCSSLGSDAIGCCHGDANYYEHNSEFEILMAMIPSGCCFNATGYGNNLEDDTGLFLIQT